MYGLLYFLLYINISHPGEPDFNELNTCLEKNTRIEKAYFKKLVLAIQKTENDCHHDYSCSPKAEQIIGYTNNILQYIDSIKRSIPENKVNKNGALVDTAVLQILEVSMNNWLDTAIHNVDIGEVEEFKVDIAHCVWGWLSQEEHKLKLLFERKSYQETIALFSALQNNMTLANEFILRALNLQCACGCVLDFDMQHAFAIPLNSYVFAGEKVHGELFVGYYNHVYNPTLTTNKGKVTKVERGVATLALQTQYPGIYTAYGTITIHAKEMVRTRRLLMAAIDTTVKWSFQYYVGNKDGAFMNLLRSNYCYTGIDNPITVSYPGYEADKLLLRVEGARVVKIAHGRYNILTDKAGKELMMYLDGINPDGSTSPVLAAKHIKVITPPLPIANVANKGSGTVSIDELKNNNILTLVAKDEDIDMKYTVAGYEVSCRHIAAKTMSGPVRITGAVFDKSILSNLQTGDRVYFTTIMVADNAGKGFRVPDMSLIIE